MERNGFRPSTVPTAARKGGRCLEAPGLGLRTSRTAHLSFAGRLWSRHLRGFCAGVQLGASTNGRSFLRVSLFGLEGEPKQKLIVEVLGPFEPIVSGMYQMTPRFGPSENIGPLSSEAKGPWG